MPALGLGVYQSRKDETLAAIKAAFDAGYRMIDTGSWWDADCEPSKPSLLSSVVTEHG